MPDTVKRVTHVSALNPRQALFTRPFVTGRAEAPRGYEVGEGGGSARGPGRASELCPRSARESERCPGVGPTGPHPGSLCIFRRKTQETGSS